MEGIVSIRMENGVAPFTHKKLERFRRDPLASPDITLERNNLSGLLRTDPHDQTYYSSGTELPVVIDYSFTDELLVGPDAYQIVNRKSIYEIGQGRISCDGNINESFLEFGVLRPAINNIIVPKGCFLARASAVLWHDRVLVFLGDHKVGKTSLLLAMLARGASPLGTEYMFMSRDGSCTAYSPYVGLNEWHLRLLPELAGSAYPVPADRKKHERELSLYRMGLSLKESNFILRNAKRLLTSRFYFDLYCPVTRIFPKCQLIEKGKATHVFNLEKRGGSRGVVESTPEQIASLNASLYWIWEGNHHSLLSDLVGLEHCTLEELREVLTGFLSAAQCHSLVVGPESLSTREVLLKQVDAIEAMVHRR